MKKQVALTISENYRKHLVMQMGVKYYEPRLFNKALTKALMGNIEYEPYIDTEPSITVNALIEMSLYHELTNDGLYSASACIYGRLNYRRDRKKNPTKRKQIMLTVSESYCKWLTMHMGSKTHSPRLFNKAVNLAIRLDKTFAPYIDDEPTVNILVVLQGQFYKKLTDNNPLSGAAAVYDFLNYSKSKRYSISTDKAVYKMLTDIGQGDASAGLKLALGITE